VRPTVSESEEGIAMRRITMALGAVALTGVMSLGTVGPAAAEVAPSGGQTQWIGGCSYFIDVQNRKVSGYCDGGNGARFRAWIECKNSLLPWNYINFGPWRDAGGHVSSSTSCGGKFVDAGVDTYDPEPI
jgi:hypothetical protein